MIRCAFCGTSYKQFQPNCKNCGAPLPPDNAPALALPPAPPPAPRRIVDGYLWRLMLADDNFPGVIAGFGSGMVLLAIALLSMGSGRNEGRVIALYFMALLVLVISIGASVRLYAKTHDTLRALRHGIATQAQISKVEAVSTGNSGGKARWMIYYVFTAKDKQVRGKMLAKRIPGEQVQTGQKWWVLYLPETPEQHALYPRP